MDESQASDNRMLVIHKGGKEIRYPLTFIDYLTLLRAVDREGPPKLAVAWTLLQRFAMLYPQYTNLAGFVSAYAQPINPDWFTTGKKHQVELIKLAGNEKAVLKENQQAQLREQWARAPLSSISNDTKMTVDAIFGGVISPVPLSSHYAAPIERKDETKAWQARAAFAQKRQYKVLDYGPILSSNWFYGETAMTGVRVQAVYGAVTLAVTLLALGLVSGFGFGALHLLKRFVA